MNRRINNLLLPYNLCFGPTHIPLSSKRLFHLIFLLGPFLLWTDKHNNHVNFLWSNCAIGLVPSSGEWGFTCYSTVTVEHTCKKLSIKELRKCQRVRTWDIFSSNCIICLTSGLLTLLKDKMIVSHFLSKLKGDVTELYTTVLRE